MGKLKNNQKGFSAVEATLILVIVILIGIVGYMVYKNHHNTTKASVSSAPANPYAGWKTYTDSSGVFTFKYPADWTNEASGVLEPNTVALKYASNNLVQRFMIVLSNTYSGSPQTYLTNEQDLGNNGKYSTVNGYQDYYSQFVNNGGDTYRTYSFFNNGKVAQLSFLLKIPSDGASSALDFSQYVSVEDRIADSIHFN
ncbi:MAG TPA: hypothetical protein VFN31_00865 [Candidatus Saccharimonadales bacterium]|nr:hypothetical protein [Candidatus Saccharimonadales bacterium]